MLLMVISGDRAITKGANRNDFPFFIVVREKNHFKVVAQFVYSVLSSHIVSKVV